MRVAVVGGEELLFSERFACDICGVSLPEITPQLFSFNSPQGACLACSGLGTRLILDPRPGGAQSGVVPPGGSGASLGATPYPAPPANAGSPGETLSLSQCTPLSGTCRTRCSRPCSMARRVSPSNFIMTTGGRRVHEARPFPGIIPWLEERYHETDSSYVRDEIEQYMTVRPCPDCRGRQAAPGGPGGEDRRGPH